MSRQHRLISRSVALFLVVSAHGMNLRGKSVGIIGGGIAGLSCAAALEAQGLECLVYDTGKRAVGGRASSRKFEEQAVDHAVQFVTASKGSSFDVLLSHALESGDARLWDGSRVGTLDSTGTFSSFADDGVQRFIGSNEEGLQSLASFLERRLGHQPVTDTWVSPSNGLRFEGSEGSPKWGVYVNNRMFRQHDMVVIAHNGKCADRITSKCPAKQINRLLRVNFDNKLPPVERTRHPKMTLNAIYSVLVAVPAGFFPTGFDGAFLSSKNVSWMACNSRKYGDSSRPMDTEVWTLLSTPAFAKRHKVPQEFIEGTQTEELVIRTLVGDVLDVTCLEQATRPSLSGITRSKVQLWGAGVPINRWEAADGSNFLYDATYGIGVVGDWLCQPSVEGAFLSGTDFGVWLGTSGAESDAGLKGRFVPAGGASGLGDIGDAPPAPDEVYMSVNEYDAHRQRGGGGRRGGDRARNSSRGRGRQGRRGGRAARAGVQKSVDPPL